VKLYNKRLFQPNVTLDIRHLTPASLDLSLLITFIRADINA